MTDETIPLAGVVGWPVAHSRSPALHGYWLRKYGLSGHYVPLGIKPQDFETGIRALPKLGFRGVNLTIPYKEMILPMADTVTDRAALIGAANTILFRDDGTIRADNTDGYGFLNNLRDSQPDWRAASGPCLVLGAGGAARAVISGLLSDQAPEIRLANRTRQRSEMLKDHFGAKVKVVSWNKINEALKGAMTIVNTTSLGMSGNGEVPLDLSLADPSALVTDIVYTPLQTGLLQQAKERGLRHVDGLGMLLHQAVPGFESWFGQRPEVDEALRQSILAE